MTETIFMIHGMWGGGHLWENYRSFFGEKGYTCISPTLRYHDVSPADPPDPRLGTTSLLDYAADLETQIRSLNEAPVVMGHSMGGILAQILAGRGMARKLVLLTPASPRGIMAIKWSVLKSFRSALLRWGFWKRPHRPTFEEAVYSMMGEVPPGERRSAYDKFVFESGRAAAEIGFWLFDGRKASHVDEMKVTCPVLVVAGSRDRITPAAVVRQVARKYKATYKEFPEHAHWVLGEPGWQDVAGFVHDWLRGG
ncbi:MAG: alpha/beta hydrolase [Acidobacteriota bacterium]